MAGAAACAPETSAPETTDESALSSADSSSTSPSPSTVTALTSRGTRSRLSSSTQHKRLPASPPIAPASIMVGRGIQDENDAPQDRSPGLTVCLSCSALIIEARKITMWKPEDERSTNDNVASVGKQLEELYEQLQSQAASVTSTFATLKLLVGQPVIEQAGLVLANARDGGLPLGWVALEDESLNGIYYHNAYTRRKTWIRPEAPEPLPTTAFDAECASTKPMTETSPSLMSTKLASSSFFTSMESIYSSDGDFSTADTSQEQGVANAIAMLHLHRKMVEQLETRKTRSPEIKSGSRRSTRPASVSSNVRDSREGVARAHSKFRSATL